MAMSRRCCRQAVSLGRIALPVTATFCCRYATHVWKLQRTRWGTRGSLSRPEERFRPIGCGEFPLFVRRFTCDVILNWLLLQVSSFGLGGIGAVSAADLAARPYTKAPMMAPVMTYNWTGCYIGGNVGGGWAKTEQTRVTRYRRCDRSPGDFGSSKGSNVIGGAQIGCDYQFAGNWVVGVQGMFDFGNINSSHPTRRSRRSPRQTEQRTSSPRPAASATCSLRKCLATSRAAAPGRGSTHNILQPGGALFESATGVDRQGWTVGGGLEWMFAPGWSVFGEYNYMDFGRKDIELRRRFPATVRASALGSGLDPPASATGSGWRELQVQLGWTGCCEVLISPKLRRIKSPGLGRGLFFCGGFQSRLRSFVFGAAEQRNPAMPADDRANSRHRNVNN